MNTAEVRDAPVTHVRPKWTAKDVILHLGFGGSVSLIERALLQDRVSHKALSRAASQLRYLERPHAQLEALCEEHCIVVDPTLFAARMS